MEGRQRNDGLVAEPLFIGLTRPTMVWGVTYSAMLVNVMVTIETFILTKNLVWLLAFVPLHGIFYLVCMYEPRFFDLLQLWCRLRLPALAGGNVRFWKANSYSPLPLDFSSNRGIRAGAPLNVKL